MTMDANATALTFTLTLTEDDLVNLADRVRATLAVNHEHTSYLNVDEAAAYLACRKRRIYELVGERKLRAYRDGRRLLFKQEDLDHCVCGGGSAR
jgi:excisionase family DNA binding protein